jgi:nucleotide-binding universal stress UspA family protein
MSTRTSPAPTSTGPVRPPFERILCGVAGTDADRGAVRQAAALAGRGGRIEVVAVAGTTGAEATSRAALERGAARSALRRAWDLARDHGVMADTRCVEGAPARARLLEEAAGHDLLVVGARGLGRAAGILLGSTATMALHRAPCPVLIARDGDDDDGPRFLDGILMADDGSDSACDAARAAVAIAAATGARLFIAAPTVMTGRERHLLAEHLTAAVEAGLPEPVVLDVQGPAPHAITALARDVEASLIVVGSRCRRGIRAIGSVSERVAHMASCSVLVTRH